MDPIIRAADVASVKRLQRPGVALPAAPVAPIRAAAPPPDAWQALEQRAHQLDTAQAALARSQAALDEREQAVRVQMTALQARERLLEQELGRRQADAEQRGLAAGEHKAQALAAAAQASLANQAADQAARLEQVLAAMLDSRQHVLAGAEDALVEIVHGALCRMLGTAAAVRAAVVSVVDGLLHQVRDGEPLRVFLHPQDLEMLRATQGAGSDARVQLLADPGIELGGCLVETARGTLDARLELQLQGVREALLTVRRMRASLPVAD